MVMNESYSKEFNLWAAGYFSWVENIDDKDVESHYMAWLRCKHAILKILESESIEIGDNNIEINKKVIEQIEKL